MNSSTSEFIYEFIVVKVPDGDSVRRSGARAPGPATGMIAQAAAVTVSV